MNYENSVKKLRQIKIIFKGEISKIEIMITYGFMVEIFIK